MLRQSDWSISIKPRNGCIEDLAFHISFCLDLPLDKAEPKNVTAKLSSPMEAVARPGPTMGKGSPPWAAHR